MREHLTNTWRTSKGIFASLFAAAVLLAAPNAHAQQDLGGFAFTSFHAGIVVNQDGSFDVTETIAGEFFEPRHGIFRFIPYRYDRPDGSKASTILRVDQVQYNGAPTPFKLSRDGVYQVIKIGDPDVTIEGPFTYAITYHVERVLLYHETTDELYWNVTGTNWNVPIPKATATVAFPPGVARDQINADCYTGAAGSTARECTISIEDSLVQVSASDFLTVSVRLPKGVVRETTSQQQFWWWMRDNWDVFFAIIPILTAFFLFYRWWHHGRDPKGRGTIVAEYEPPDSLRPIEVGALMDAKVHERDFTATVVDLAVRGYLQIIEKDKVFTLKKKRDPDGTLKPFETSFLETLFMAAPTAEMETIEKQFGGDATNGLKEKMKEMAKRQAQVRQKYILGTSGTPDEVVLDGKTTKPALARSKAEEDTYKEMAAQGYYLRNPRTSRLICFGIAIAVAVIAVPTGIVLMSEVSGKPTAMISLLITAGLLALVAPHMPKRTEKGAIALEHAKGFKLFLATAEKYRIQWQEKEGIFEKYLPYAMVFGVADKWARALAGVSMAPSDWYSDSLPLMSPTEFSDRISSFADPFGSVSAPSSSGGGGGGRSSGGGGGGGGGGSW